MEYVICIANNLLLTKIDAYNPYTFHHISIKIVSIDGIEI